MHGTPGALGLPIDSPAAALRGLKGYNDAARSWIASRFASRPSRCYWRYR